MNSSDAQPDIEMEVRRVRQAVIAAFSDLAVPDPARLIGPSKGDQPQEEQIRGELAGRDWRSLEADFLTQKWAFFCYLSAEGYRYYLPALITTCLAHFSEEYPLIHSTLYYLQPSYWDLYYQGTDRNFLYQTSLFTPQQTGAVCSFLELVFDRLPAFQFASAKALKWGWNMLPDHPALRKALDFYAGLQNYTYPPAADPAVDRLVSQIAEAFAETPYPGDDRLCGSRQGDEPAEYAMEFRGLPWNRIHPAFLSVHYASLSFFSKEGFRYFLPAYLTADLLGLNSNGDVVFHLTHGLAEEDSASQMAALAASPDLPEADRELMKHNLARPQIDWRAYAEDRFSVFNLPERRAIIAYLQQAMAEEFNRERIQQALSSYWLKTI